MGQDNAYGTGYVDQRSLCLGRRVFIRRESVLIVCFVWGVTVVADSAQFSSSVTELAPPNRIGTMLTVQTCAGVPLTAVTIKLLPLLVDLVTWRYAFMVLAIGPFVGVVCMLRLRQHPDAEKGTCGRR